MPTQMQEAFRCPTCRAAQELSATCRRCRCDLGLVVAAVEEYRACRRRCLLALAAGHTRHAVELARECLRWRVDPETFRLLAVCALYDGDWPTAYAAHRRCSLREQNEPSLKPPTREESCS